MAQLELPSHRGVVHRYVGRSSATQQRIGSNSLSETIIVVSASATANLNTRSNLTDLELQAIY